jgi:hypothetical protein
MEQGGQIKMRDKNLNKVLLSIVAALVLLGGATSVVWINKANDKKAAPAPAAQAAQPEPAAAPAAKATQRVSYDGVTGKTALELLKTEATVVTKDSSYGPYVDSINGVSGGTDGKYWAFYVNGKLAEVGADAYVTKGGDKIEWKFE